MNIGPFITNALNARNAYTGGQRQEEDSNLQKALLLHQIQQQDTQQKLAAALQASTIGVNNARVGNYQSLGADRQAKDEADPVTRFVPAEDGTGALIHKSGRVERVDSNGNPVSGQPKPPATPQLQTPGQSDFSVSPTDTTAALRGELGLRPQGTPGTPDLAAALRASPPPQQATLPQATQATAPAFGKPPAPQKIDPFGPAGIAAKKDVAAYTAGLRPKPQQSGVFVGDPNNPNAPATYKPRSEAFGGSQPQRAAGGLTGGTGAGGIGGLARTSAAITGMAQAEPLMTAFENDPQKQLDGLDYWAKMRASMYDAKGIKDEAVHAAVYSHLNQTNPKLANYLRNAETWALEDSQLSGRGSDFRTKLDGFISQIGPNADPTQIANTQKFRQTRLAELQRFQPAMQAIGDRIAGGGGRGGANPDQHPGPVNLGGAATGQPDLATRAGQLKAQGLSKEAARAQLVKEGLLPP